MIEPRNLAAMIEDSRLDVVKTAIVAELRRLLLGVTVVPHPGKLDINDVVAKAVVAAPGVAVGWSRIRADRLVDGAYDAPIEWAAYIVVQDLADVVTKRATPRDAVAHAIGSQILDILNDPDHSSWGIPGLDRPAGEPAPALTPMFTAKSWTEGVAYYAVTWTQVLAREGRSFFGGPTPAFTAAGDTVEVETTQDPLPPEIRAFMREFASGGDA